MSKPTKQALFTARRRIEVNQARSVKPREEKQKDPHDAYTSNKNILIQKQTRQQHQQKHS